MYQNRSCKDSIESGSINKKSVGLYQYLFFSLIDILMKITIIMNHFSF